MTVLKKIVINEISCVDKPAQKHARALIIKRMEEATQPWHVAEDLEKAVEAGLMAELDKGDVDGLIKARVKDIRRPGERDASAYTRCITDDDIGKVLFQIYKAAPNVALEKAKSDAPNPPLKPFSPEVEVAKLGPAHARLHAMALDHRKAWNTRSYQSSFSAVYSHRDNRELREAAQKEQLTASMRGVGA
jgi:hypothetical protein